MLEGLRQPALEDLPGTIPIFPLPAVLLLPRRRLPLNIFEPRYLNMTLDALGREARLIGMVQPVDPCSTATRPEVYRAGCAGRISAFSETGDGRLLITLTGVCRFHIAAEIETVRGYRRVRADYRDFAADLEPEAEVDIDRDRVLGRLADYFKLHDIKANWATIRELADEDLVSSLCMSCPFEPSEKQALLEAPDLAARAETLIAILEMALHGSHGNDAGARQ